jgi:hypothetical protein
MDIFWIVLFEHFGTFRGASLSFGLWSLHISRLETSSYYLKIFKKYKVKFKVPFWPI